MGNKRLASGIFAHSRFLMYLVPLGTSPVRAFHGGPDTLLSPVLLKRNVSTLHVYGQPSFPESFICGFCIDNNCGKKISQTVNAVFKRKRN